MGVVTDETGLHSEDCECAICEAGFRPSPGEREVAARELLERKAAAAKRLLESAPMPVRSKPPPFVHVPLTKEQREELRKLREEMFGK